MDHNFLKINIFISLSSNVNASKVLHKFGLYKNKCINITICLMLTKDLDMLILLIICLVTKVILFFINQIVTTCK